MLQCRPKAVSHNVERQSVEQFSHAFSARDQRALVTVCDSMGPWPPSRLPAHVQLVLAPSFRPNRQHAACDLRMLSLRDPTSKFHPCGLQSERKNVSKCVGRKRESGIDRAGWRRSAWHSADNNALKHGQSRCFGHCTYGTFVNTVQQYSSFLNVFKSFCKVFVLARLLHWRVASWNAQSAHTLFTDWSV